VGYLKNTILFCHAGRRDNVSHVDDELVDNCNKTDTYVYLAGSIRRSPGIQSFLK
jgi:hypothetical protein